MPRRRVKIEFEDADGSKYALSLQGGVSREKVLKILDLVDLVSNDGSNNGEERIKTTNTSVSRLRQLIDSKFPLGAFTSNDLLEAYEDEYSRSVKLSTVSTYLSRMSDRGSLRRHKAGSSWSYRRNRLSV